MTDQDLEAFYGPASPYSEHKRGDRITFTEGDEVQTGTIVWVCSLHEAVELSRPILHVGMAQPANYVNYIVTTDQKEHYPYVVWPGDVIEARQ